mmetsp:Transcript_34428/g.79482  ORF Transcript_34428/g.79482 Transcript_34428/m.79482 type:complete len:238 (+) Transcript_34428:700-1413(+)
MVVSGTPRSGFTGIQRAASGEAQLVARFADGGTIQFHVPRILVARSLGGKVGTVGFLVLATVQEFPDVLGRVRIVVQVVHVRSHLLQQGPYFFRMEWLILMQILDNSIFIIFFIVIVIVIFTIVVVIIIVVVFTYLAALATFLQHESGIILTFSIGCPEVTRFIISLVETIIVFIFVFEILLSVVVMELVVLLLLLLLLWTRIVLVDHPFIIFFSARAICYRTGFILCIGECQEEAH